MCCMYAHWYALFEAWIMNLNLGYTCCVSVQNSYSCSSVQLDIMK